MLLAGQLLARMATQGEGLTFDEIDMIPARSAFAPNAPSLAANLGRIQLGVCVLGAPMATSASPSAAIELAKRGGLYFLDRNFPLNQRIGEVTSVKRHRRKFVPDPVTVGSNDSVASVIARQRQPGNRHFKQFPVVDGNQLSGMTSARNRKLSFDPDDDHIGQFMTPVKDLVVGYEGMSEQEALARMREFGVNTLPSVKREHDFTFCGMWFLRPFKEEYEAKQNGVRLSLDAAGRYLVGAAVSAIESIACAEALVDAGADALVIDLSHGNTVVGIKRAAMLRNMFPDTTLVSPNIVTSDAAEVMVECGMDALRVGYGSGATCISSEQSGFGIRPMMAVHDVSKGSRGRAPIIIDGGIRSGADLAKGIAAGAELGMLGTLFGGTDEAPGGEPFLFNGMYVKPMAGNGSAEVMAMGGGDRYEASADFRPLEQGGYGVVQYRGPISGVIDNVCAALRLALATNGSADLNHFRKTVRFMRRSAAGAHEAGAHGIMVTRSHRR